MSDNENGTEIHEGNAQYAESYTETSSLHYAKKLQKKRTAKARLKNATWLKLKQTTNTWFMVMFTTLSFISVGLLADSIVKNGEIFSFYFEQAGGKAEIFYAASNYWFPIIVAFFMTIFFTSFAIRLKFGKTVSASWWIAVKVLSTAIALSWLTDTLAGERLFDFWYESVPAIQNTYWHWTSVLMLVTALLAFLLYWTLPQLIRRNKSINPEKAAVEHPALVLSLSSNVVKFENNILSFPPPPKHAHEMSILDINLRNKSISDIVTILKNSDHRNNWEVLLKAIAYHSEKLEHIVLIGTKGSSGSHTLAPILKQVIDLLLPQVEVTIYQVAVEANSVEHYCESYECALNDLNKRGFADEEIVVDITGGKSSSTAAAAMTTLHRKASFQYVDTENTKDVMQYQMELIDDSF